VSARAIEVVALIVTFLLAASSAAAETAFTALTPVMLRRMEERGRVGRIITSLRNDPNRFLTTILVLSSSSLIITSSVATLLLTSIFPNPWGVISATVGVSILVLVFAELTPKNIAVRQPEAVAIVLARPVRWFSTILRPVIVSTGLIVGALMQGLGFGGGSATVVPTITEDEVRHTIDLAGQSEGGLTEEETERIEGILDLDTVLADEVMRPRPDIVAVPVDMPLMEALDTVLQHGHSRIPVYEDNIDKIVGVLYDKDLLKYLRDNQVEVSLRDIAREAIFVPESKRASDLLREFQRQKVHMAIVLDEYGGTAGLVTIEDILEEIVGEIQDEYDTEAPLFEMVSDSEWLVDAGVRLEEVNEEMDLHLSGENGVDTLGGFVFERLGEVPEIGDVVQANGVKLEVVDIEGRRIKKVRITRLHLPEAPAERNGNSGA
jgi:putative hemolysin